MSQEHSFETIPLEITPEFQGEVYEEENERGSRRPLTGGGNQYSRPRSQPGLRPKETKRPPIPKSRPIPRGARRPWEVIHEPYPGEPEPFGSERVRWVQDCLNRIFGLQLPADGILDAAVRSAIRSLQQQEGLPATGIVSPGTEQALQRRCREGGAPAEGEWGELPPVAPPPPALIRKNCEVLDQFELYKATLWPFHASEIKAIAGRIRATQTSAQPIRSIRVVGHTDSEGTDSQNLEHGRRRAQMVASALGSTLRSMNPSLAGKISVLPPESKGESQPVANNVTPRGRASNRRVEIFFDSTGKSCMGCSFRHFFAEYDLRFLPGDTQNGIPANPNMTTKQQTDRTNDVGAMVTALVPRRNARAAAAAAAALLSAAPPANPATGALKDVTKRLSDAQLALYRQCFPDGTGGINFDDFQRCFEQFANGELRDPDPAKGDQGGPNGGFFFLFAEFAFLCIDSGVDKAAWIRALEVFVKTQEIFMHVFRPPPHKTPPAVGAPLPTACATPRPLDGTTGFLDKHFNKVGQSDEARKRALRAKYAPMRADATKLADAVRENLFRTQCML